MIDGVKINMGGTEYIVPPLSFKQLRNLLPKMALLTKMGNVPDLKHMDIVTEIVFAALSRNYPELTLELVGDLLDLGNMKLILPAIIGTSGLVSSGEAQAAS